MMITTYDLVMHINNVQPEKIMKIPGWVAHQQCCNKCHLLIEEQEEATAAFYQGSVHYFHKNCFEE